MRWRRSSPKCSRNLAIGSPAPASAQSALGALADGREIDVVFSDVMMPGEKNGLDLAAEVSRRRPNLKILLTTGYAAGLISNPSKDVHVLRKPYDIRSLERGSSHGSRWKIPLKICLTHPGGDLISRGACYGYQWLQWRFPPPQPPLD